MSRSINIKTGRTSVYLDMDEGVGCGEPVAVRGKQREQPSQARQLSNAI